MKLLIDVFKSGYGSTSERNTVCNLFKNSAPSAHQ